MPLPAASRALPPSLIPESPLCIGTQRFASVSKRKRPARGFTRGVKSEWRFLFFWFRIRLRQGTSFLDSTFLSSLAAPSTPLHRPLSAATGRARRARGEGGALKRAEGVFLGALIRIELGATLLFLFFFLFFFPFAARPTPPSSRKQSKPTSPCSFAHEILFPSLPLSPKLSSYFLPPLPLSHPSCRRPPPCAAPSRAARPRPRRPPPSPRVPSSTAPTGESLVFPFFLFFSHWRTRKLSRRRRKEKNLTSFLQKNK